MQTAVRVTAVHAGESDSPANEAFAIVFDAVLDQARLATQMCFGVVTERRSGSLMRWPFVLRPEHPGGSTWVLDYGADSAEPLEPTNLNGKSIRVGEHFTVSEGSEATTYRITEVRPLSQGGSSDVADKPSEFVSSEPTRIQNLVLVRQRGVPASGIEIDNDNVPAPYDDGRWETLLRRLTKTWVTDNRFRKEATLWLWTIPSDSFRHQGRSIFVVPHGLPKHYLQYIETELRRELKGLVRAADSVIVSPSDGWKAKCHIKDGAVWQPEDAVTWIRV